MGLREFLDNARRDASTMVHGFIPGMHQIYGAAARDLDTAIFGPGRQPASQLGGRFKLDDVARAGYQGFVRDSPILPLLTGDIKEAGNRLYERPISSGLDLLGAGAVAGKGLKAASYIPGPIGESALRLRGFREFNPAQLGTAVYSHEFPAKLELASGEVVPTREYLLRRQIETYGDKTYAKRTMRSPRSSGNETFDAALDKGETLADDPLVSQSVPRARFQPFASMGDVMNFGPKLGSARFGRRLAIRSQSRLRTSVNEMMASHGRVKKMWEKTFGKDSASDVGDAQFLAAAGMKNWDDVVKGLEAFQDSGRQAILGERGVDLSATKGERFNLNKSEFGFASDFVKRRNKLVNELADDIAKLNENGYKVVLTGGKAPLSLSPDAIRARPQGLYDLLGSGNLHIKPRSTSVAPAPEGQLFDPGPPVVSQIPDRAIDTPVVGEQLTMTSSALPEFPKRDVVVIDGESFYRDGNGELIRVKDADSNVDGILKNLDEQTREHVNRFALEQQVNEAVKPAVDDFNDLVRQVDDIEAPMLPHDRDMVETAVDAINSGIDPADLWEMMQLDEIPPSRAEMILKEAQRRTSPEVPEVKLEPIKNEDTPLFDSGDTPRFPDDAPTVAEDTPDGWNKKLRAKVADNYSQAQWHKNALDNLVRARLEDGPDISQRFAKIVQNPRVKQIFESPEFWDDILPQHKAMVAAQLEADKARLGANALSNDNVVRNSQRLAMIFGNEDGHFFVARPRRSPTKKPERVEGTRPIEVVDHNNPGDPFELIAKGTLDTSPEVHLNNYLKRRNEAANQELSDAAIEASISITPQQHKAYISEGIAVDEPHTNQTGKIMSDFVVIRPGGKLFEQIESMQPLAAQAARRLREEGFHEQASNISSFAKEMFNSAADGDFSLGDMIRNPKLRGELEDSRYMMPTDMYKALVDETSNATNALSSFLQAASTGFKVSVLHGRWPAWVVNNTIGAQLYLAFTGGLGKMIPHTGGRQLVRDVFPDVVGSGSREMGAGAEDLGRIATTRKEKLLDSKPGRVGKNVIDTLSDWNQKIADEPARLDRLEQVVEERFQSTMDLAKARGIEIPDTLESRRKMLQDIHVREDIAKEVLDDMIDFTNMSRRERMWVASVIPFWSFIKGSTKSTQRLVADHPGRVWAPMEIGSMGSEYTDQEYPSGVPEYMRSILPMGGNRALSVGGWNPWGQQQQLLGGALSMLNSEVPTGQDHPLAMVNPILTMPVESVTNREFYTQYPMTGNVFKNMGKQTMASIPLLETILSVLHPGQPTGRESYIPSRRNTLLDFAGIPVRDVNPKNLNVRLRTDENRRRDDGVNDYWKFHSGV